MIGENLGDSNKDLRQRPSNLAFRAEPSLPRPREAFWRFRFKRAVILGCEIAGLLNPAAVGEATHGIWILHFIRDLTAQSAEARSSVATHSNFFWRSALQPNYGVFVRNTSLVLHAS
jgi:hypothetical protein